MKLKLNYKKIVEVVQAVLWIAIMVMALRATYHLGNFLLSRAISRTEKQSFDVVVACQTIASQAVNKGWVYKNCLEELSKTLPLKSGLILKI